MNNCKSCKFWDAYSGPTDEYRTCNKLSTDGDGEFLPIAEERKRDGAIAYSADFECYYSSFNCKADFGCVLWEPSENNPAPKPKENLKLQ